MLEGLACPGEAVMDPRFRCIVVIPRVGMWGLRTGRLHAGIPASWPVGRFAALPVRDLFSPRLTGGSLFMLTGANTLVGTNAPGMWKWSTIDSRYSRYALIHALYYVMHTLEAYYRDSGILEPNTYTINTLYRHTFGTRGTCADDVILSVICTRVIGMLAWGP